MIKNQVFLYLVVQDHVSINHIFYLNLNFFPLLNSKNKYTAGCPGQVFAAVFLQIYSKERRKGYKKVLKTEFKTLIFKIQKIIFKLFF